MNEQCHIFKTWFQPKINEMKINCLVFGMCPKTCLDFDEILLYDIVLTFFPVYFLQVLSIYIVEEK